MLPWSPVATPIVAVLTLPGFVQQRVLPILRLSLASASAFACLPLATFRIAARGQFELAYGPGGAWSNLCARSPGFRGTTLLRDTNDPQRYLAFDFWDTIAQREQMLVERQAEYADLEAAFSDWTESKREVGVFRLLAEATVQPRGKAHRSQAGVVRRRGRR